MISLSVRSLRCSLALLTVVLLIVIHGCSSGSGRKPVYAVQGKAFKGTEPLVGAYVAFVPVDGEAKDATRATGSVMEDGSFQLTTYDPLDGAPEGEYNVTITWPDKAKESKSFISENRALTPDKLKGAYSDPKTTKLRARVEKKPVNEIKLDVS